MAGSVLGNRVLRKEDPKFLTTGGRYIEDLNDEPLFAGALHVTYVRSSVAHAKITNIDLSDCKNSPGVVAVFTAQDLGLEEESSGFNAAAKRAFSNWQSSLGRRISRGCRYRATRPRRRRN